MPSERRLAATGPSASSSAFKVCACRHRPIVRLRGFKSAFFNIYILLYKQHIIHGAGHIVYNTNMYIDAVQQHQKVGEYLSLDFVIASLSPPVNGHSRIIADSFLSLYNISYVCILYTLYNLFSPTCM